MEPVAECPGESGVGGDGDGAEGLWGPGGGSAVGGIERAGFAVGCESEELA